MAINPGALRGAPERRFYTWAAVGAAVVVFAGFARTYYLKGVSGAPELPGLLHLHGVVMTLWFTLFLVQVRLVAGRRVDLHRRLGVVGALLAVLVLMVGVTTAIGGARRGAAPALPPLVFLAVPLGDMLVFAGLVGAALWYRGRPGIHKRLMLLSSLSMLTAAIGRIPLEFIRTGGPLAFFGLTDLFIVACVAFDTLKNRRLHPAFGWGGALVVASQPLRLLLAGTPAWMKFATWLVA